MPTTLPTFPVDEIPFSRRGAWFGLSMVTAMHRTATDVHLVSHVSGMHAILSLRPEGSAFTVEATPAVLTWRREGAEVQATFHSSSALRVRGRGAGMTAADVSEELTPFTGSYLFRDPMDGSVVFTSYESGRRYRLTVLRGTVELTGVEALGSGRRALTVRAASGDEDWEFAIEEYDNGRAPYRTDESFDTIAEGNGREFQAYLDAVAGWRTSATPAAALATYVLWSATVAPAGFLTRESVLMSKHWMDKVWSWDHCFNALALAPGLAREALDQFLIPFDHQAESGALPDSVTHSEVLYNFVKPPIHGWALRRLRALVAIGTDELNEIYNRLAEWTRFWLRTRTAPGRNLPHYQHGNDSGWDNSTMFDRDRVVEAPDLAAFLLVQLDTLADLADELERGEGDFWRSERGRMQTALMTELHDEDGFFAVGPLSGARSKRQSLLLLLPVVAAAGFDPEVQEQLAAGIKSHLTEWGPATEPVQSPDYEADGYWRGPIWAPSTVLIEDGLRRAGFTDIADEVSARFRALCERSGFAENFDARTGEGLRDRAYTWTASAYLLLASEAAARAGEQ
ncbi:amylo-alpha-1,6-glucosidase [Microbacterium sp.]|uniref:amylo-alpha-1,6-glucosidase n=1 Tax=Microbacterium sp. TaxID=51671 RepID=UPI00273359E8|nr:glycogen debranching protein [Microbacterium sp.]MDP3952685.1 glycogen debranching protein [Microbacterium sp.]